VGILRDQGLRFSVVLTGADHGNLEHVRQCATDLGLADVIHFLGFVPRADIVAFYRGAFALAFFSFYGPESLPPLEAMALGCPVVISDAGDAPGHYGEGPIFVNAHDAFSIAQGIKRLYDDPQRRAAAIEAGRVMAQSQTSQSYVRHIVDLLDEFEPVRRSWAPGPWPRG
jgi:glycosyltransferase involved in cell wall biosynthesis